MKRSLRYVLAAVAAAVLLSAAAWGAEVPGPCELFAQADAEALFNEPVSPGVSRETVAPAGKLCRYSFRKSGSVFGVTVRVCTTEEIAEEGIFGSAGDVFARQVGARTAHEEASKTFQEVGVTGGEAFWEGTALWVLKGDVLFLVEVHAPLGGSFKDMNEMNAAQEKQNLALARTAAGVILERLK
jgi:hypothetical protein